MKIISCILVCLVTGAAGLPAADYLGAKAALEKAAASLSKAAAGEGDSQEKVRKDLAAFQTEVVKLPPKEGAAGWLALVDRGLRPQMNEERYTQELEFGEFVKALPAPAGWGDLRAALGARKVDPKAAMSSTLALRWFVNRLLGDTKAMQADYEAMAKGLAKADGEMTYAADQVLQPFEDELFALSDDGEALLKQLDGRLEMAIKNANADSDERRYGGNPEFRVPDLVTLVGKEKAAKFLTRALTSLNSQISARGGEETGRLAAELALEKVAQLKAAQWELAAALNQGKLYQALLEKFGAPDSNQNGEFARAQAYEFLRLILAGKTDDAVALSKKMNAGYLSFLREVGQDEVVAEFFHKLLSEKPELPFWDIYVQTATRAGKAPEMLALMRAALKGASLRGDARQKVQEDFVGALLAAGELDEAVKLLTEKAKADLEKTDGPLQGYSRYRNNQASFQIARIGQLTGRPEWVKQGVALAEKEWAAELQKNSPGQFQGLTYAVGYARLLMDLDRGPEAEAVLVKALEITEAQSQSEPYRFDSSSAEILSALAGLYTWANRPADVMILLDQAPGWGGSSIGEINQSCYIGDDRTAPLELCAARALAATGRKDEARRIVETMLEQGTESDRVYELLVELAGQEALGTLDQVFAQDPFEERPLIWKAKLLLDAGKAEEAEKVAREAIKIDPSDGGQGAGDRMRVYDLLAQALAAKGDTKNAEFFKGVTKSIRLSEKADRFYEAGLYAQAIKLYEESLTYFADAYCIQSRLALRLAETGDWKAAEEHYRRAYELMPDSFGRVESHCFGCERAFAGEKQQTIAEKIFNDMATAQPAKPQVHYLLGYLRMENGRYKEALPAFQKAVELDPDYLNAWEKLSGVARAMHLPTETRNSITANLLRLDPWQRHGQVSLTGVTNLAEVWKTLAAFAEKVPAAPRDLYPLKASAEAREAAKAKFGSNPEYLQAMQMADSYRRMDERDLSPGGVFSGQEFTRAAGNYLRYSQRMPQ